MKTLLKALGIAFLATNPLFGQTREVSSAEAGHHLQKKVAAVYPQMAQIANIRGYVVVRVAISERGKVTDIRPVSGNPLLLQSATSAIRQWRYRPFRTAGHSVPVETSVLIAFPSSLPAATPESEEKVESFYKALMKCTVQVATNRAVEAEPVCRQALAFSMELDPSEELARMEIRKEMGRALFFQGKLTEALENYQEELSIAQKAAKTHGGELAGAHRDVGDAMRGSGDFEGAAQHYEKAEGIYRPLCKRAGSESEENDCATALWRALRNHADVLRQIGQPSAADSLEKEAAGIVVKSGPPE